MRVRGLTIPSFNRVTILWALEDGVTIEEDTGTLDSGAGEDMDAPGELYACGSL